MYKSHKDMNYKNIIYLLFFLLYSSTITAQISVSGGIGAKPFKYDKNLSGSGIESIYFLNTFTNATLTFESDAAFVRFFKYSYSLNDAKVIPKSDITTTVNGSTTQYIISNLEDSKGYYAEVNGAVTSAIWIIDYSKHLPLIKSITTLEDEDKCEYLKLLINKDDNLLFYTNNGGSRQISRLYTIKYNNLIWDEDSSDFSKTEQTLNNIEVGTEVVIDAPLLTTKFTITGDQIGESFGISQSKESDTYTGIRTEAHIIAEQTNSTTGETITEIGGSAPANVSFKGKGNEPTTYFYTWFIYNKKDMKNTIARYTDQNISYIFKESGSYRVILEVADQSSVCIDSTSIDLSITDFSWEVPNFLLLDGSRVFKISYKSIVQFKCTIFNRWGNKIYEWTDPSQGWDGKYNGKEVSPGVYFYVMTAIGGDGKKHQKSGDINVLKKK